MEPCVVSDRIFSISLSRERSGCFFFVVKKNLVLHPFSRETSIISIVLSVDFVKLSPFGRKFESRISLSSFPWQLSGILNYINQIISFFFSRHFDNNRKLCKTNYFYCKFIISIMRHLVLMKWQRATDFLYNKKDTS